MNEFERCLSQSINWIGKAMETHEDDCDCPSCQVLTLAAVNLEVVRERSRARWRRQQPTRVDKPLILPMDRRTP